MNRCPAAVLSLGVLTLVSVMVSGCSSSPGAPAGGSGGSAGSGSGGSAGTGGSAGGGGGGGQSSGGNGGAVDAGGSGGSGGRDGAADSGGTGSGGSGGGSVDGAVTAPDAACTPGTGSEAIGGASVRDRKTCLVWQKVTAATAMTNKQAAKFCDDLAQDGFSDWRTPTPEELATWPNLAANSNAYITGPVYIPTAATSVEDGCRSNSHSCNLTQYNAGSIACAWQGVGFTGPAVCVRGTAAPGSVPNTYAAATCDACRSHVAGAMADFKPADCLPYATP